MATSPVTVPTPSAPGLREERSDRYQGVRQYSLGQIVAVWAAAALPMGLASWVIAPRLADGLIGVGDVPMFKALILALTAGLVWQFVLVVGLVWFEQRTLRWSRVRDALWLRSPRSPHSGRIGGRLWLITIPLVVLYASEEFLPAVAPPAGRDLNAFFESQVGQDFMSGNWGWFSLALLMFLFNTVLGEELLFRGVLLPRMNRAFGRGPNPVRDVTQITERKCQLGRSGRTRRRIMATTHIPHVDGLQSGDLAKRDGQATEDRQTATVRRFIGVVVDPDSYRDIA